MTLALAWIIGLACVWLSAFWAGRVVGRVQICRRLRVGGDAIRVVVQHADGSPDVVRRVERGQLFVVAGAGGSVLIGFEPARRPLPRAVGRMLDEVTR